MKKFVFRQIPYMLLGIAACGMLFSGCALRPEGDDLETKEEEINASDNDVSISASSNMAEAEATAEETDTDELIVVVNDNGSYVVSEEDEISTEYVYETVEIEDLEEPTDEDGEWTDYILDAGVLEIYRDDESEGYENVKIHIDNLPVIYVEDTDVQTELNAYLYNLVQNRYMYRFQLKDLDIELTCTVISATRFVSYEFSGEVYHTGSDERYEDEREYLYYMTIDRMTGTLINLETAYGVENAYYDILNGDYEVIRAEESVFERFEDDLLADVYVNEPVFEDDLDHELDFYIDEDNHVCVVVWVGEENGSYAILKLGESKL